MNLIAEAEKQFIYRTALVAKNITLVSQNGRFTLD